MFSTWKVNIAENPIAAMGLYISLGFQWLVKLSMVPRQVIRGQTKGLDFKHSVFLEQTSGFIIRNLIHNLDNYCICRITEMVLWIFQPYSFCRTYNSFETNSLIILWLFLPKSSIVQSSAMMVVQNWRRFCTYSYIFFQKSDLILWNVCRRLIILSLKRKRTCSKVYG